METRKESNLHDTHTYESREVKFGLLQQILQLEVSLSIKEVCRMEMAISLLCIFKQHCVILAYHAILRKLSTSSYLIHSLLGHVGLKYRNLKPKVVFSVGDVSCGQEAGSIASQRVRCLPMIINLVVEAEGVNVVKHKRENNQQSENKASPCACTPHTHMYIYRYIYIIHAYTMYIYRYRYIIHTYTYTDT